VTLSHDKIIKILIISPPVCNYVLLSLQKYIPRCCNFEEESFGSQAVKY